MSIPVPRLAQDPDSDWRGFAAAVGGRASQVLFEAASLLGDCVYLTDEQARITWANQAMSAFVGYPQDQMLGRRRQELASGPLTGPVEQLTTMRQLHCEFPTHDGTGRTRWVSLTAFPVTGDDDRPTGMICVERDLTEEHEAAHRRQRDLRRAESLTLELEHEKRLLSVVLATVPHVVWWKGRDLRYIGCNEAFLRLRGLAGKDQLIGRQEEQLPRGDGFGEQLAMLERTVLDTDGPVIDAKLGVGQPERTYQFSVVPYLDGGQIAGVVGIGADISHATELERQLAQATRLEAIGQLSAGIAHEINTPVQYASDNTRFVADAVTELLGGLRSLQQLVDEPTGSDAGSDTGSDAGSDTGGDTGSDTGGEGPACGPLQRVREILTRLDLGYVAEEVPSALAQSLEGLDRVAQIVRAMKDFSHPGQGRSEADLNRLITSTVQVSRNEWKYVATIDLDLDPAVGAVPCFEGDLKQVVLNIVVNAAHAIDEQRRRESTDRLGRIAVSSRRTDDEAVISISDNGTGMDERTRQRVFDPFFTTKEVGRGTGQGLTLALAAMKKHGGRIEVTSVPGEGSTFRIALPLKEPTTPDDELGAGARAGAPQERSALG
jgi:two-component system, NtrC family, sensor kinase